MKRLPYSTIAPLTLLALLVAAGPTRAQDPADQAPPPDAAAATEPSDQASEPDPDAAAATEPADQPSEPAPETPEAAPLASWLTGRNPFWPIGYEPPLDMSDDLRRRLQLEARATWPVLEYTTPTRLPSGDMVTIVKGHGIAETGTIIRVERNGIIYRWEITKVDANGIQARRLPLLAVKP